MPIIGMQLGISEKHIIYLKRIKQNELIILGPGTPDRVLYKGVPRTSEVKVKGIYLVVSQKDNPHNRERDRKWAEREAKRNANRKDGKLPIFTVHI